jgi:DNA primase
MLNTPPEALKIADVVSTLIRLEPSRKILKGNCPFHKDNMVSFMVNPEKNSFKCFGCGVEGGPKEFLAIAGNKNLRD